ncbi:DUF899 family protein [Lederbergia citrisecunda]|uniref:DUF899 family protein n=1 Tax=Lederbergia citrisecunda TaxID=2833583 RepID=UPI001F2F4A78|nr:DUF899 family protein [Lederbergia citrisecunda]
MGSRLSSLLAADNIGHLAHLHARNTSLALVSRAPLSKLQHYKERMGWSIIWYSSFDSDFSYDFLLRWTNPSLRSNTTT